MWLRWGEGSEAGATGRPNLGALQGDLPPLHWTFQQIIGGAGATLGPPNARALGGAGGCRAHGDWVGGLRPRPIRPRAVGGNDQGGAPCLVPAPPA